MVLKSIESHQVFLLLFVCFNLYSHSGLIMFSVLLLFVESEVQNQ